MNRFLVDAQLPALLAARLRDAGYDAIHTSALPHGNSTPDREIVRLSREEQWVVVTKDADFVREFLSGRGPFKLLLVSAGNLRNQDLYEIVERYIAQIDDLFNSANFIEVKRHLLVMHQ